MKKQIIALTFLLSALCSYHVNAQLSLGGGLAYGTEVEDNGLGIQARTIYGFNEKWRAAADFIKYLDGLENISVWEFNVNGHYVFANQDKFSAYALAGLNFVGVKVDVLGFKNTETETGLNLGVGGQLKFSESLSGLAELKYNVGSDIDQLVIGVGVVYTLGR